jgi:thiamine biosynthesis lipoprotein
MTLSRRRFICLATAGLAVGPVASVRAQGETQRWQDHALGTRVQVDVVGVGAARLHRLWKSVERELTRINAQFSLYQPSILRRLNKTGLIRNPSPQMLEVFDWADRLHRATHGVFDPTVQALWLAHAQGTDLKEAHDKTGWHKLSYSKERIWLPSGMSLTFNGLLQGYAADRIAGVLRAFRINDALVDMGEIYALGRNAQGQAWQVGIADAGGILIDTVPLEDRALATSSPAATRVGLGRMPHIMHPQGRSPRWSTVSVSARQAVLADGLATAFCLMDREEIAAGIACFEDVQLRFLG